MIQSSSNEYFCTNTVFRGCIVSCSTKIYLVCLCVLQGWVRALESTNLFSMLSLHSVKAFQPDSHSVLSFSFMYLGCEWQSLYCVSRRACASSAPFCTCYQSSLVLAQAKQFLNSNLVVGKLCIQV